MGDFCVVNKRQFKINSVIMVIVWILNHAAL